MGGHGNSGCDPLSLSPSSRDRRLRQILEEHRADRARITQRTRSVYEVGRHHQTSEDKLDAAISELCRIEREFQSFQHVAKARQELLKRENECYRQRLLALGEDVSSHAQQQQKQQLQQQKQQQQQAAFHLSSRRYERTVSAVNFRPRARDSSREFEPDLRDDAERDDDRRRHLREHNAASRPRSEEKSQRPSVARGGEVRNHSEHRAAEADDGGEARAERKESYSARKSEVRRRAVSRYMLALNESRAKAALRCRKSGIDDVKPGSLCDPNTALLKPSECELKLDQLVDARVEAEFSVDRARARKQRSGSIRAGLKWPDNISQPKCTSPAAQHSSWRSVTHRLAFAAVRPSLDKDSGSEQRRSARLPKSLSRKWTTCF